MLIHQNYGASPATQAHTLLRNTGERGPPWHPSDRSVLDLQTPEEWKAELTLAVGYILRYLVYLTADSQPQ